MKTKTVVLVFLLAFFVLSLSVGSVSACTRSNGNGCYTGRTGHSSRYSCFINHFRPWFRWMFSRPICQPVISCPTGMIEGEVYVIYCTGEPDYIQHTIPYPYGWEITLTRTGLNGITYTKTVTTDANGYYEFTGLKDGTYTLEEEMKPGYSISTYSTNTQSRTVTIANGETKTETFYNYYGAGHEIPMP